MTQSKTLLPNVPTRERWERHLQRMLQDVPSGRPALLDQHKVKVKLAAFFVGRNISVSDETPTGTHYSIWLSPPIGYLYKALQPRLKLKSHYYLWQGVRAFGSTKVRSLIMDALSGALMQGVKEGARATITLTTREEKVVRRIADILYTQEVNVVRLLLRIGVMAEYYEHIRKEEK